MLVFGCLGVLYGVGELIAPVELMRLYGIHLDPGGAAIVRLAAALNIGFGTAVALSRTTTDTVAQRALLVAGLAYALVALAVTAHCTLTGATNAMMWSNLAIFLPLAGNAGWLLARLRS